MGFVGTLIALTNMTLAGLPSVRLEIAGLTPAMNKERSLRVFVPMARRQQFHFVAGEDTRHGGAATLIFVAVGDTCEGGIQTG